MRIKVSNVMMPLEHSIDEVFKAACKTGGIDEAAVVSNKILRRSVDARKGTVRFNYSVLFELDKTVKLNDFTVLADAPKADYFCEPTLPYRPMIAGMGPAGLFAGYYLAKCGCRPIIIERGGSIEKRTEKTAAFAKSGVLDTECNIQFGEGGAGTFSDGKLTTRINDPRCDLVLDILAQHGAPQDILYLAKPHIGTDLLRGVIVTMRNAIIAMGGEIRFDSRLDSVGIRHNRLVSVVVNGEEHECKGLLLATGHSARDTYQMLFDKGVAMSAKPFAVGVRIEHLQEDIDRAQYGKYAGHPMLGAADYRLTYNGGRSVFSFCMCPGGSVVAAASEECGVAVNGMSNHSRSGKNANSAIVVSISERDFDGVLGGVSFQRRLERAAYELGGGGYFAPVQLTSDFVNDRVTHSRSKVEPTYPIGTNAANLANCLPEPIVSALKDGLRSFDTKIKGFTKDSVLTGLETRTSAPVRILRGEHMESVNVKGLYPVGEGAGYAGGIMSSAVDGIKAAQMLLSRPI